MTPVNNNIQIFLMSIITVVQYQLYQSYQNQIFLLNQQNAILTAKLESNLSTSLLLSHKVDLLNTSLATHTVTVASKTSFLECAVFAGVITLIFLIIFRPDSSEATIDFIESGVKQLSKENGQISNRIDDIAGLLVDKVGATLVEKMPSPEALQSLDTVISQLYK